MNKPTCQEYNDILQNDELFRREKDEDILLDPKAKDPFSTAIKARQHREYLLPRLKQKRGFITERLTPDVMDMVQEIAEELIGDKNLTNEELDEYLYSARFLVLRGLICELETLKDEEMKKSPNTIW